MIKGKLGFCLAQKRIHYISREDVMKLEGSINSKRDRLILEVLYETGCTVGEAVKLKKDDLDVANKQIGFPAEITKSKTPKTSRISERLSSELDSYLEEREKEGEKSRYLFSSRQSESMTTKRVRQLVQKYGRKTGLGKILPQMIRYAHVMHAVEKGLPLAAIEKQTGLDKIRLVQIMDTVKRQEPDDIYLSFFSGGAK